MKSFRQKMDTPTPAMRVIRKHYGLDRWPTFQEVSDEKANLLRKREAGTLDDRQAFLVAKLNLPA